MRQRVWVIVLMIVSAAAVGVMTWWAWPYISDISGTKQPVNTTNHVVNVTANTNAATNTNTVTDGSKKTYTDPGQVFSFQYPTNMTVLEGTETVADTTYRHMTFSVGGTLQGYWLNIISAKGETDPVDAFIKLNHFDIEVQDTIVQQESTKFGITSAVHYCSIPGAMDYCAAFALTNDVLYVWGYRQPATLPSAIMSSFAFVSPVPTSWKTYTNATYGIQFRYPKEFTDFFDPKIPDSALNGKAIAAANHSVGGSIGIFVLQNKYSTTGIDGLYGEVEQDRITPLTVGSQPGISYMEGDGGAGGMVVRTALGATQTLRLTISDGEDGTDRTMLYTNTALIQQILDSVIFTK